MPLAFPTEQLSKARAAITDSGESIAAWARRNNFDLQITGHVLRGSLKATRGEAHRVAVALGLRKRVAKKRKGALSVDGQIAPQPERRVDPPNRRVDNRRTPKAAQKVAA